MKTSDAIRQRAAELYHIVLGQPVRTTGGESLWPVPWRADEKPSLRVNADGLWYDDPSATGGDVFDFLALKTGRDVKKDFPLLVADAARILGIPMERGLTNGSKPSPDNLATVMKTRLAALAAHYGLEWADFQAARCSVQQIWFSNLDRKDVAVVYPLLGLTNEQRRKAKTVERYNVENKVAQAPSGKRSSSHPGGGSGFFPASIRETPKTPETELVLCAGEEKVLALIKAGFTAASYSCGEGRITSKAAKFLVDMGYKRFVIVLDAGPETDTGAPKWAEPLTAAGATSIRVVKWPDNTPDKTDLNDVLKASGVDAVKSLIEAAISPLGTAYVRPKLTTKPWTTIATTQYPALRWAIVNFLPEGLSILAGPPKAGKTLISTELAACVGTGRSFLGYDAIKGEALYIDAETGESGLSRRMKAMGWESGADGVEGFCPQPGWILDAEGIAELDAYKEKHPNLRLVVVDTLERLIPRAPAAMKMTDAYQQGVARLSPIQQWANKAGVCVLLVHHTSKSALQQGMESFDAMSGSRGLTATAETLMTMVRQDKNKFKLSIESRHMPALELAAVRSGTKWGLFGDFEENKISEERKELLEFFEQGESTAKDFAEATGCSLGVAKVTIHRAVKSGHLVRTARAHYKTNPSISTCNPVTFPEGQQAQSSEKVTPQNTPCNFVNFDSTKDNKVTPKLHGQECDCNFLPHTQTQTESDLYKEENSKVNKVTEEHSPPARAHALPARAHTREDWMTRHEREQDREPDPEIEAWE